MTEYVLAVYVIVRGDGKYIARRGLEQKYTSRLEDARIYRTPQAARRDCECNEFVADIGSLLKG